MNVGQAITEACQRERDADREALLRGLWRLRNALLAYYWWGWSPNRNIDREGRRAIHGWGCPSISEGGGACSCSVMAWRLS